MLPHLFTCSCFLINDIYAGRCHTWLYRQRGVHAAVSRVSLLPVALPLEEAAVFVLWALTPLLLFQPPHRLADLPGL